MKKEALIIVDAQKDFWEKGWTLYVNEWELIVPEINKLIEEVRSRAGIIVASRDWHPENHESFKIWPIHCVKNTRWAEYLEWLNVKEIDYEVLKWFRGDKDSYSAFGWFEFRWDYPLRDLNQILIDNEVKILKIVWLATDYCVKATALDAIANNFEVELVQAWIRAVNIKPLDWTNAIQELKEAWVIIL